MAKEQQFQHPPRGHVALLAYDSANDRFQVVHVNANGQLQVDVAAVADRQFNAHGYDGSAWHKQPPIWGYTDRLAVNVSHAMTESASYTIDLFTVPVGYVYVVNAMMSFNTASVIQQRHRLVVGLDYYDIKLAAPQPAGTWLITDNVSYPVKAGDKCAVLFFDAVNNDVLYAKVWGYKMAIAM